MVMLLVQLLPDYGLKLWTLEDPCVRSSCKVAPADPDEAKSNTTLNQQPLDPAS
jgi:hypothetical protein